MGRAYSILVLAQGDLAIEASAGLKGLGFAVTMAAPDAAPGGAFEAVVSFSPVRSSVVADRIHLAVGDHAAPGAGARLQTGAHPIQIAARLRALIRLSVLEDAADLRAADARAAGVNPAAAPVSHDSGGVLFVGAPCPAFLRLEHALRGANVDTIAAFSTFTAFDYLHERAFDAVVLNTEPDAELAHTVCSAMRRNTRLYHTPAILLTRGEAYAGADEAFARGASDLLSARAGDDDMRQRVTALALERRRRRRAKALLEACRAPAFLDQSTDLFALAFGERHLASLLERMAARGQALSLVALTAEAPAHCGASHVSAALDQFASMLRHCVRAEDLAVRADAGRFWLALPNTRPEDAQLVAARVAAIAECTAYEGRDPLQPFRLDVISHVFEPAPGGDVPSVLASAFSAQPAMRAAAG
ncbi:diguanylate cyclase [Alkalicaulis satelles]|uniref:Diguanylate cyclase n=1 Tax=Alkalicaulis satelles TaxID=2609175 RepID=A0A5M6ZN86_9PROT|nr:diguanylate cyclase [Alkalicaulis satelles]KAA5804708.1 diguanylate cyclase [Alkalicaulis satelles]